jgi:CDP-diacylglycerol--serine O-phosphatidyltransferase
MHTPRALWRFLLPVAITFASLFCGFGAILYAASRQLIPACLAIGASCLCDSLDGWLARRLRATSRIGMELDSLADIVAFGIAPALLVYRWALPAGSGSSGIVPALCLLSALAYVACAAGRLARFNITAPGQLRFRGLPTPGAAGTVAALVAFHAWLRPAWPAPLLGAGMLLTLAGLMISSLEYADIRRLLVTRHRAGRPALAAFALLMCWRPAVGLLLLALAYTASGLLASLWNGRRS